MVDDTVSPTEAYSPDHLLDSVIGRLRLKNDAALSRALEVGPPLISKIRHRKKPVGAGILLRMHEVTGLSIGELRALMGDRRNRHRFSHADKGGGQES